MKLLILTFFVVCLLCLPIRIESPQMEVTAIASESQLISLGDCMKANYKHLGRLQEFYTCHYDGYLYYLSTSPITEEFYRDVADSLTTQLLKQIQL